MMTTDETIIERASPADAAELLEYLRRIGAQTDNLTFGAEGLPLTTAQEEAYLASFAGSRDGVLLVARAFGRIVGDASLTRLPRRMSHRGELGIAVDRDYWGRGVGTRLMEALLAFARENGFSVLELQVRSDNLRAKRLYERFGFETFGTHPAFFRIGGEDVPFDCMILRL